LETQKIALDRYKAKLDFWKFMGASVFAAIVIATIPPIFQWANEKLESARKDRELSQSRATFHDTYIKDFLEKGALNQDIEIRIRLAKYFADVSDDSYKAGWSNYFADLSELRNKLRMEIDSGERQLYDLQQSRPPDDARIAEIKRDLAWKYGELGYSEPNRDVVRDPRSERRTLVDAIDSLTDAQAITVYKTLAPNISSRRPEVQALLKLSDPNDTATSNGVSAKAPLKRWVAMDGDPAFDTQVIIAIKSAQGTGSASASPSGPGNDKGK